MPITYVLRSAASDLTGGADFTSALDTVTAAAAAVTVSLAKGATEDSFGFTASGEPGTRGTSTGTFTVEVNVTTGNTAINLAVALARVTSAGAEAAITAFSATQAASAGVKAFSFLDPALGVWAAGDRLKVIYRFVNTNAMSIQDVGITVNTVDAEVVTPFTAPKPVSVAVGRFGLAAKAPSQRTDHKVTVTARSVEGGGDLTYALFEGATERARFTQTLTSTLADYTGTLTQAQMDAIVDYSLLELRLSAAKSEGPLTVEVAEASFTAPSSAGIAVPMTAPATLTAGAVSPPTTVKAVQSSGVRLFQSADNKVTVSLPNAATPGHLLTAQVGVDKSSGAWAAPPAGWQEVGPGYVGTSVSQAAYWRVADGTATDTTITMAWTTINAAAATISEWPVRDATAPTVAVSPSPADDAIVTTITADAGSPAAAGVSMGFLSVDTLTTDPWAPTWTGGYENQTVLTGLLTGDALTGNGGACIAVATKRTGASGTTGTTATSGASDQHTMRVAHFPGKVVPTVSYRLNGPTGIIATRTAEATSVRLKLSTDEAGTLNVTYTAPQTPNAQGVTFHQRPALAAGRWFYRTAMTDANGVESLDSFAAMGQFLVGAAGRHSLELAFYACNNASNGNPASLGTIADLLLEYNAHLGDVYYHDGSGTSLDNFRNRWLARLTAPHQHRLGATSKWFWTASDHDGMNNGTTAGSDATAWKNLNTVVRELLPLPFPAEGFYYSWDDGPTRFIVLDTRSFKTLQSATDDAAKTALGATQKQWLKDLVTSCPADMSIIIANEAPWVGAAIAGDDTWYGYTTERTELGNFFAASGQRITMLGGDMHALAYHDGSAGSPGGIQVFQAAPLQRTASQKGGPWTGGPIPASGTTVVEQFGRLAVDRTAIAITHAYRGFTAPATLQLSYTHSYAITTGVSAAATLTAAPRLTAGAVASVRAAAPLTAPARLAAAARADVPVAASLAAPVRLTAGAQTTTPAAASLTAAAAVAVGAQTTTPAAASLTAAARLAAAGKVTAQAAAALTAAARLVAAGRTTTTATVSLTAAAALTAGLDAATIAAAPLTAAARLQAASTRTTPVTAGLTAAARLQAAGVQAAVVSAALTSRTRLAAGTDAILEAAVVLTAAARVQAAPTVTYLGAVTLAAPVELAAAARGTVAAAAGLLAQTRLAAATDPSVAGAVTLLAQVRLVAATTGTPQAAAAMASTTRLTAAQVGHLATAAALTAHVRLQAAGVRQTPAAAQLTARAQLVAAGAVDVPAAVRLTAAAQLVAAGRLEAILAAALRAPTLLVAGAVAQTAAAAAMRSVVRLLAGAPTVFEGDQVGRLFLDAVWRTDVHVEALWSPQVALRVRHAPRLDLDAVTSLSPRVTSPA